MAGRPAQKEAPLFGQRLAALRRSKGLSQRALAERLNTTREAIDYYERRAINPTLDVIERVAEALEVPTAELLGSVPNLKRSAPGRSSQLHQLFESVARLPRRQQDKVIEFVSAFVERYEQQRQN